MSRYTIALFAWCLLYASGAQSAETACVMNWTTDRQRLSSTGIVLKTGIEGYKVGQPPPPDFLEKIRPLLCATGTEELRVRSVSQRAPFADPAKTRNGPSSSKSSCADARSS